MSDLKSRSRVLGVATLLAGALCFPLANAAETPAPAAEPAPPENSALDAPLMYQLLIGEIELRAGEPGAAYQVILDAARRTHDDSLFRRAVDVALQARAGDQALAATRAWRNDNPKSVDAMRLQLQILAALNRLADAGEPLQALLAATPDEDRAGLIAALPRFLGRSGDTKASAELLDKVLKPYAEAGSTRVIALVATGRAWLAAGDAARALDLARQAQTVDAASAAPALLALELIASHPDAEKIVNASLQRPDAEVGLRLAYVRTLTGLQRYPEAIDQLETVTRQKPELAPPYLSLGALYLEMHRPREGESALLHYLDLAKASDKPAPAAEAAASAASGAESAASAADNDEADEDGAQHPEAGVTQAWLLLSQSAEQRGDFKAAEAWLARIDDPQRALEVQTRRASILAHQGKIAEARELIHKVPERSPEDVRSKLVAEAAVLRDVKRWKDAFDVLGSAVQRYPEDTDLIYEQAMMAEKLDRIDEMERLLRRVIELKPNDAQAHNALGYSFADRRIRLPEARSLIQRALELAPGDPFITDSLGWVEYRMGNHGEALKLLRKAYETRPDPEIAAHLGEVLWAFGQREEARKVWQEAKGRDAGNDVLRETLTRLKVGL